MQEEIPAPPEPPPSERLATEEPPELVLDHAILYHGSPTSGISAFNRAEESTVGLGLYLTSSPDAARGYALHRYDGAEEASPVVYEVETNHLRLANLSNHQMLSSIMTGFLAVLEEERSRAAAENMPWYSVRGLQRTIDVIRSGAVLPGRVKLATRANGQLFTSYLEDLGYDGLKTMEGGEGSIGNHDTYVIFNPENVTIRAERDIRTA